jgi:hypothetical protein
MTMAPHSPNDARKAGPAIDAISAEIGAMQAIADALTGIRDPETRQRVLQWAIERFSTTPRADATAPRASARVLDDELALGIDRLDDLFDGPLACTATPVSGTVESEFADFEVAAPVIAEPMFTEADLTELDFIEPAAAQMALAEAIVAQAAAEQQAEAEQQAARQQPAQQSTSEPAVEGPDAQRPGAARDEQALDTLVKGFASDLQRLALEWQIT